MGLLVGGRARLAIVGALLRDDLGGALADVPDTRAMRAAGAEQREQREREPQKGPTGAIVVTPAPQN